jgi:hypothetical protein
MRLIWTVIPLLLIGVIGITHSFAETNSSSNDIQEPKLFSIFDEETTLLFNEALQKIMKEHSESLSNNTQEVESFSIFDEETTLLFNEAHQKMMEDPSELTSHEFFNDRVCRDGLQLIFKSTDNSSACVTSDTFERLLQRGWGYF